MKFVIEKPLKENIYNLMRRLGYHFQRKNNSELVFYRSLGRLGFPRFHIYLKEENRKLIFNLHLDQKKPIYKGVSAHAGEYDGKIVENEAERIKQILR